MSDSYAAGAEAGPIDVVQLPAAEVADRPAMTSTEAARALASYRYKKQNPDTPQAEAAPEKAALEPATPSGDEPVAGTDENPPTGDEPTESATDTQDGHSPETAPIEPPRSWTKEAKERFASLPRDTQEYLAQREEERDRDISRRQNEAAEKLKGLTVKEQAVEQARQQYETARQTFIESVPGEIARFEQEMLSKFPEIANFRSQSDYGAFSLKLAQEDWPRASLFEAMKGEWQRLNNVKTEVEKQRSQETQKKLSEFEQREAKLISEKIPEFADPDKRDKLQKQAVAMLNDLGFTNQELGDIYRTEKGMSIHDHRVQLLIYDGLRYRQAQAAKASAIAKPLPPVQRPGTSQPRGAAAAADVQNLARHLEKTGSLKDAARLVNARRAAAAR